MLPKGAKRTTVMAKTSGWISDIDALGLGQLLVNIGAGRTHPDDQISHGAGIVLLRAVGDHVEKGEPLMHVDHDGAFDADPVAVFTVANVAPEAPPQSRLIDVVRSGEASSVDEGSSPQS